MSDLRKLSKRKRKQIQYLAHLSTARLLRVVLSALMRPGVLDRLLEAVESRDRDIVA